jgi:hypothetical protein
MESIDKTKPLLSAWQKLPQKKLKNWNLQSLDDVDSLEVEPRKRYGGQISEHIVERYFWVFNLVESKSSLV